MRKLALSFAAAFAAATTFAASPAATQQWVKNYIATSVVANVGVSTIHTNGVTVYSKGTASITYEDATVYALMATNVTPLAVAQGVTNNMYFVWNEPIHSYTNHSQVIEATTSNFVWHAIQSVGNSFNNYFSVVGRKLQPGYAKEVTK